MPHPRVLLLHYEATPPLIKKLRKIKWTLAAYDESQRIKARASLASRTAAKLHDSAEYKLLLSGTPIDENPADLWAQFRFLNRNALGTRWADFEDEYLEEIALDLSKVRRGSFKWHKMLRTIQILKRKRKFDFDKLPQLLGRIKPYALRVTKEDVLDLPPLTYIDAPVTLRGAQRKLYDELESELVASTINLTAPLRVTQVGKLQQICGGYVIDDDKAVHEVGRAKIRRVRSILNDHVGQPVVIFARYLEEVRALAEDLRISLNRVETITGKVKKKERAPIIAAFQAGKIDALVCQIKTGGVGIDLFRSHVGIIYSPTYSWIDFDQAISRLHRRGQENAVSIYLIYAADTIDTVIFAALKSKSSVTSRVLNHLKRRSSHGKSRENVRGCRPGSRARSKGSVRPARAA